MAALRQVQAHHKELAAAFRRRQRMSDTSFTASCLIPYPDLKPAGNLLGDVEDEDFPFGRRNNLASSKLPEITSASPPPSGQRTHPSPAKGLKVRGFSSLCSSCARLTRAACQGQQQLGLPATRQAAAAQVTSQQLISCTGVQLRGAAFSSYRANFWDEAGQASFVGALHWALRTAFWRQGGNQTCSMRWQRSRNPEPATQKLPLLF